MEEEGSVPDALTNALKLARHWLALADSEVSSADSNKKDAVRLTSNLSSKVAAGRYVEQGDVAEGLASFRQDIGELGVHPTNEAVAKLGLYLMMAMQVYNAPLR